MVIEMEEEAAQEVVAVAEAMVEVMEAITSTRTLAPDQIGGKTKKDNDLMISRSCADIHLYKKHNKFFCSSRFKLIL